MNVSQTWWLNYVKQRHINGASWVAIKPKKSRESLQESHLSFFLSLHERGHIKDTSHCYTILETFLLYFPCWCCWMENMRQLLRTVLLTLKCYTGRRRSQRSINSVFFHPQSSKLLDYDDPTGEEGRAIYVPQGDYKKDRTRRFERIKLVGKWWWQQIQQQNSTRMYVTLPCNMNPFRNFLGGILDSQSNLFCPLSRFHLSPSSPPPPVLCRYLIPFLFDNCLISDSRENCVLICMHECHSQSVEFKYLLRFAETYR